MIGELEDRVRERAHGIWEREGRPSGRAEVHWTMALAELTKAEPEAPGTPAMAAPDAPKKRKPRAVAAASTAAAPKRRAAAAKDDPAKL